MTVEGSDLGLRKIQDGRLRPRMGCDGSWKTALWGYCLAWDLVFEVYIWRNNGPLHKEWSWGLPWSEIGIGKKNWASKYPREIL